MKAKLVLLFWVVMSLSMACSDSHENTVVRLFERPVAHTTTPVADMETDNKVLPTGWYPVVDVERFMGKLEEAKPTYRLKTTRIIGPEHIESIRFSESSSGSIGLHMLLTENGTETWHQSGDVWITNDIGFVLDNRLLHVTKIMGVLDNQVALTNLYLSSQEELETVASIINGQ